MLDDWMWKFLMEHSSILDEERGVKHGLRRPWVNPENLSNDDLVENALSWLLD